MTETTLRSILVGMTQNNLQLLDRRQLSCLYNISAHLEQTLTALCLDRFQRHLYSEQFDSSDNASLWSKEMTQ